MKSRYPMALFLSLIFLSSCTPSASPPSSNDVINVVKEKLRKIEQGLNESNADIQALYQQMRVFSGTDDKPKTEQELLKEYNTTLEKTLSHLQIRIVKIGKQGTADLQAPGSHDLYWPVNVETQAPEDPKALLKGLLFIYRNSNHQWKGRIIEAACVVDGHEQAYPRQLIDLVN